MQSFETKHVKNLIKSISCLTSNVDGLEGVRELHEIDDNILLLRKPTSRLIFKLKLAEHSSTDHVTESLEQLAVLTEQVAKLLEILKISESCRVDMKFNISHTSPENPLEVSIISNTEMKETFGKIAEAVSRCHLAPTTV